MSLLLGTGLVLSCTTETPAGPTENRGPTAKIVSVPSGPILEGSEVTFVATSSSDPDGDSLAYLWNVGDGLPRTGPNTARGYVDEGSYDVTLIVTDEHGASDTATTQVSVENAAPVVGAIVTPDGSILVGTSTEIRFWFRDPGITDTVTLQIDWKDGTTSAPTLSFLGTLPAATAAHTYSTPGSYAVEVTVHDNDGGITKHAVERPITVVPPHTNHPPVARIDGPASGSEGASLFFSAARSTDPDGDSLTITLLSGDGRSEKEARNYYPRLYGGWWAYPDDGTYVVSVIVADDSGAADTASMPVAIRNAAPAVLWWSVPTHAAAGAPASVQVLIADSGSSDRHTIAVDWGDGARETVAAADTGSWERCYDCPSTVRAPETVFHTYATTGTYSITVTANDDDGGVSSSIITSSPVTVFNANGRQSVAGYEAMDLGTLGGNSARPADLNDRGEVVGTSRTGLWFDHAFHWDQAGMRDLGTLGHEASHAVRINEAGVIAGTVVLEYLTGVLDDNVGSVNVGAMWVNGAGRILDSSRVRFGGPLREPATGYRELFHEPPRLVRAINALGEIAWTNYSKWDTYGWLWRNGSWQPLETASWGPWGAGPSRPTAMNDGGQVVGARSTHNHGDGPPFHAILWEGGSSRDLGVLAPLPCGTGADCSNAVAMDINESGQIVGISTDNGGRYHFVLWEDDKIEDLGPADWVYPQSAPRIVINDHGEIAGSVAGKAFIWGEGVKVPLVSPGGELDVVAMNENGTVVGNIAGGSEQHAFVWSEERGMIDLGTGPSGFSAAWVVDINARGDILGYTAPCRLDSQNRCANSVNDYASGRAMQTRAILWRSMQATASR